jgi:hypothetical protein
MMVVVLCVSLGFALAACGGGGSGGKIDSVQNDYAALISEHNEVAQLFADAEAAGVSINQDAIDDFDAAAGYINEFGAVTLNDKSDEELDEYISDISGYRGSLREIKDQLESSMAESGGSEGEYSEGEYEEDNGE